ncbi:hypothetical protein BV20DRAFT_140198 [Pilatotrama ljubarskyi]|nr:hypothetical protein BV20DRAFT_140198 [Pilatotrama ljubarskyi]
MAGLGYFAFPPPGGPFNATARGVEQPSETREDEKQPGPQRSTEEAAAEATRRAEERARKKERESLEAMLQAGLQLDQELALQGEIENVRMGFSIRDRFGRVDKERTEFIRAEMLKRDELAKPAKRWEAYEKRWRALLASKDPVIFQDIPWPTTQPPMSVGELDADDIVDFFLDLLEIPGCSVSEYARFRSAILRGIRTRCPWWWRGLGDSIWTPSARASMSCFVLCTKYVREIREDDSPSP